MLRTNANGYYIHRNNLSRSEKDQIDSKKVEGISEYNYDEARAAGYNIDIGHKKDYEFWRIRNAAESLGWTQAQYDDFRASDMDKHYQFEEHNHNIGHSGEETSSDVTSLQEEMLKYQKEQEENGNWKKEDGQNEQNLQGSCKGSKK